ncbi:MAG: hypothetical protein K6L75_01005 [Cellvibrionaceae bacterium]
MNASPAISSSQNSNLLHQQSSQPLSNSTYDDEIDLLELIQSAFKAWKVWLLAAFVITAIYGYFQVISYLRTSGNALYSKAITLNFKGADQGEYPSGAPYRIQDIIAPAVLQSVFVNLDLSSRGLNSSQFQNRIAIEPYTPFYREINAKYNALLDSKNLDASQIQTIQESKQRELNQALSSNVILTFDPQEVDLPSDDIEQILKSIPLEWARQAVADKGVLKADIQLISSRTLDEKLFEDVDYVVLSDLFADKIKGLRSNIEHVKELEGSATVRDPETGWSLSDLENNLYDLETYTIDELMSPIRSLGLSRNPKLAAFYYDEKRLVLKESLAKLEDESLLIKSAFDSYSPDRPNQLSSGNQQANTNMPVVSQMGGELLDKLLQVAGEDSVEKYRQVLNDRWIETTMELVEVKSVIRSTERLIAAVKGQQTDELTKELREEYLSKAEVKLPSIIEQMRDYYDINWRIYEQISRERVGSIGYLYKDAHQGVLRSGAGLNVKRIILIYVALIVLMTFVVVPFVMIRNALKTRAHKEADL